MADDVRLVARTNRHSSRSDERGYGAWSNKDAIPAAADAYEAAARIPELGELPLERRAEWADLHRRLERPARFAEVFAPWCDAEGSPATGGSVIDGPATPSASATAAPGTTRGSPG